MFGVKLLLAIYCAVLTINKSDQSYINRAPFLLPHPNKCQQAKFDAAGFFQGDFTLFKDKFFWQPSRSNYAMEIHSVWPELPLSRGRIHAVYERDDGQVWFFIGRQIHVFDGPEYKKKLTLHDIGIDAAEYSNIKAIFQWPDRDHTYIMSGEDYWRFNGSKVYDGYPKKIENVWKDSEKIDTAFSRKNQLFSLSGEYYYEFDPVCMKWKFTYDGKEQIASTFSDCGAPFAYNSAPEPRTCKTPDFETASEDARWIMNFLNNTLSCS